MKNKLYDAFMELPVDCLIGFRVKLTDRRLIGEPDYLLSCNSFKLNPGSLEFNFSIENNKWAPKIVFYPSTKDSDIFKQYRIYAKICYNFNPLDEGVHCNVNNVFPRAFESLKDRLENSKSSHVMTWAEFGIQKEKDNYSVNFPFYMNSFCSDSLCYVSSSDFSPSDLRGRNDLLRWMEKYSDYGNLEEYMSKK